MVSLHFPYRFYLETKDVEVRFQSAIMPYPVSGGPNTAVNTFVEVTLDNDVKKTAVALRDLSVVERYLTLVSLVYSTWYIS